MKPTNLKKLKELIGIVRNAEIIAKAANDAYEKLILSVIISKLTATAAVKAYHDAVEVFKKYSKTILSKNK